VKTSPARSHPRAGNRPCRARPVDRSLVAEDQSAAGVRDQTGPEPTLAQCPDLPGETLTAPGRVTAAADDRIGLGEQIAADLLPEAGDSRAVKAGLGR
jgi:hypothetical protein